jgi:hypothetical protein
MHAARQARWMVRAARTRSSMSVSGVARMWFYRVAV